MSKKRSTSTNSMLLLLGGLLIFIASGCNSSLSNKPAPLANDGLLDLTNWDFKKNGIIGLDGEWEFYWAKLYTPTDIQAGENIDSSDYYIVPGIWNELTTEKKKTGSDGFATFRLQVEVDDPSIIYSVKMDDLNSAYRFWADGKVIASNGIVGETLKSSKPQNVPLVANFRPKSSTITFVLQLSNFQNAKGGIVTPLEFGPEKQVLKNQRYAVSFDSLLFGSLFIMFIYHLVLFLLRRKDESSLVFAIFCLIMSLRITLVGERLLLTYFPNINWEFAMKLEYLTFYAGFAVFLIFLRLIYPKDFSKAVLKLSVGLCLGFCFVVIAFSPRIFALSLPYFQILAFIISFYMFYVLILSVKRKRDGALIMIFGFMALFIAALNDSLYYNQLIDTGDYFSIGIFIFFFSQSSLLSLRFAKAFKRAESLSETFQKFVPSRFLDRIAKQGIEHIRVGNAESAFISILFSDIRSFTSISETMSPQDLMNYLNAYLKRMNKEIHKNHGYIDKFIGDAIMALFDRSEATHSESAIDSVLAAIAMQEGLDKYNAARIKKGYAPFSIGIGIHSGPVIIGTVGSSDRMDSTVLGDGVNTASRMEGLTKHYGAKIIVSSITMELLEGKSKFKSRELDWLRVKGKSEPIGIYEILDSESDEVFKLKTEAGKLIKEGLMLRRDKKIDEACTAFSKALQIYPDDLAAQVHLDRCKKMNADDLPENWDGAIDMDEK